VGYYPWGICRVSDRSGHRSKLGWIVWRGQGQQQRQQQQGRVDKAMRQGSMLDLSAGGRLHGPVGGLVGCKSRWVGLGAVEKMVDALIYVSLCAYL
jgi:hypothetical protein